jgi:hypothetical protein
MFAYRIGMVMCLNGFSINPDSPSDVILEDFYYLIARFSLSIGDEPLWLKILPDIIADVLLGDCTT